MTISKEYFLGEFNTLTNKWIPSLGIQLSADSIPRSETQPVIVNATFDIDVNYTHQTLVGRRKTNLGHVEEVAQASKQLINTSLTGKNKHLCDILHHELSSKSLFSHDLNKIPLETYNNSCLISCHKCSSVGKVNCSSCFGEGKKRLLKDILVGHEEYFNGNRLVKREPKFKTVTYFVQCNICNGSGNEECPTCDGWGSNTYIETVEFFAKNSKLTNHWTKFIETLWVNDYLKSCLDGSSYKYTSNWSVADIVVTNHGNGQFSAQMSGKITGTDCNCTMTSDFGLSQGSLKILGGFAYDCDYIYSRHIIEAVNQAIYKNDLSANTVYPITSSKMFNQYLEFYHCNDLKRSGEPLTLNMINEPARENILILFSSIKNAITNERINLPLMSIAWQTVIMFFVLCLPLAIGAHYFGNGVYEQFNIVKIIGQLFTLIGKHGQARYEVIALLIFLFIPALLLMAVFGASRKWTVKRIFRWFGICAPVMASILTLYEKIPSGQATATTESLLTNFPIMHVAVFAVLSGILLTRKKLWNQQIKHTNQYGSYVLDNIANGLPLKH